MAIINGVFWYVCLCLYVNARVFEFAASKKLSAYSPASEKPPSHNDLSSHSSIFLMEADFVEKNIFG
jgi:hypothetical protein